jgi:hypothetical protein
MATWYRSSLLFYVTGVRDLGGDTPVKVEVKVHGIVFTMGDGTPYDRHTVGVMENVTLDEAQQQASGLWHGKVARLGREYFEPKDARMAKGIGAYIVHVLDNERLSERYVRP